MEIFEQFYNNYLSCKHILEQIDENFRNMMMMMKTLQQNDKNSTTNDDNFRTMMMITSSHHSAVKLSETRLVFKIGFQMVPIFVYHFHKKK